MLPMVTNTSKPWYSFSPLQIYHQTIQTYINNVAEASTKHNSC